MAFAHKYPRPAFTIDCLVFGFEGAERLLIQREREPFPGGLLALAGWIRPDREDHRGGGAALEERKDR